MEKTYKNISVGADRFLSLKWADFAFDLFVKQGDEFAAYRLLQEYLAQEIKGKESCRKTANQLRRLWLTKDKLEGLRQKTLEISYPIEPSYMPYLHLGMAINLFPIFDETARAISLLSRLSDSISKRGVISRVMETFANPASIPRSVTRVFQTLADWEVIKVTEKEIALQKIVIRDPSVVSWFILAILYANKHKEIPLHQLENLPQIMGLQINDVRKMVDQGKWLKVGRNSQGVEIVSEK